MSLPLPASTSRRDGPPDGGKPLVIVVGGRPGDRYRVPRTARALSRLGLTVCDGAMVNPPRLGELLRGADRAAWILHAGAWPIFGWSVQFPLPSGSGRPLCALGALYMARERSMPLAQLGPNPPARVMDDQWALLLKNTGGDLDQCFFSGRARTPLETAPDPTDFPECRGEGEERGAVAEQTFGEAQLPSLGSVYLEAPLAKAVGAIVEAAGLEEALRQTLGKGIARVVRCGALDVCQDYRWRVAEVITSLHRGGAERMVLDLMAALPQDAAYARLITTGRPMRETFPSPQGMIDVSASPGGRQGRLQAAGQAALNMHADVLHTHLLGDADMAILADTAIPALVTVHNMRSGWPEGMERLSHDGAALAVACSCRVEQDMRQAGLAIAAGTIWNGIDFNAYRDSPRLRQAAAELRVSWGVGEHDYVLLALANPRPQKCLHRLPGILELAGRRVREARPACNVKLIIAGEANAWCAEAREALSLLEAQVARHGVGQNLLQIGAVEDVPAVIAASDALVSVSEWEGLSLAMIEALAGGLRVVATDVGGNAELAQGNPAMTLVPPDLADPQVAQVVADVLLKAEPRAASQSQAERAGLGGSGESPSIRIEDRPLSGREAAEAHFDRLRMARRYARVFPRAIHRAKRSGQGKGLWLVTNNFSTGGAQSSARRLLTALAGRGWPVRAAVSQEQASVATPGRMALLDAGINVLALATMGSCDAETAIAQLLEAIDGDEPQAVVMWNLVPHYKVLLADWLLDVPLFDVSPGEMYFASLRKFFASPPAALPYRTPQQYGARLAGVIVKFEDERLAARQMLGAPVTVIANGVAVPDVLRPRQEHPTQPLVIGTAARISPQKKLEELIEALRLAHDQLPPYVLQVAGGIDGDSEPYGRQLRELGEGLPIQWLGQVQDIPAFLAGLDLFAMISEPAGCPNASLEAMAGGLAVIATDVGGMREQVVDGLTGRLTPRGDARALAEALVDACGDRPRLLRWGEQGWLRAREMFSIDRMARDYERVLFAARRT